MAKKCKTCPASLPNGDRHTSCIECRADEKGEDPCVKGDKCKYCENLLKIEGKRKKDFDKLLDENDEKSKEPSIHEALKAFSDKLDSLATKVNTMEKGGTVSGSFNKPTLSVLAKESSLSHQSDDGDHEQPSDEEIESKSLDSAKDPDPSYVEMIQSVKSLLDLPEPDSDTMVPPSAFKKKQSHKATKRQLSAFPPQEDLQSMWGFRYQKASGKDAKGSVENTPLHSGSYLQYSRVNMGHYLTMPQLTPLKAQKLPESFSNLSNDRTPNLVNVPWRQHLANEKVSRENVQILEHVVFFKRAILELNERVSILSDDIKADPTKADECLDILQNNILLLSL